MRLWKRKTENQENRARKKKGVLKPQTKKHKNEKGDQWDWTHPDEQLTPTTMLKISILHPECNNTTPNAYLPILRCNFTPMTANHSCTGSYSNTSRCAPLRAYFYTTWKCTFVQWHWLILLHCFLFLTLELYFCPMTLIIILEWGSLALCTQCVSVNNADVCTKLTGTCDNWLWKPVLGHYDASKLKCT